MKIYIYGLASFALPCLILVNAFIKTNNSWTSETLNYFIFNPFWAPFIVVFDKFFNEKLQVDYDKLKSKVDRLTGLLDPNGGNISVDTIRAIIYGKDEQINTSIANAYMEKVIEESNPLKNSDPVDLKFE